MRTYAEAYVERSVDAARTRVDEQGGANPVWNQVVKLKFRQGVAENDVMAALNVDIYAHGHVREKPVGSARVLLTDVLKGGGDDAADETPLGGIFDIAALSVAAWELEQETFDNPIFEVAAFGIGTTGLSIVIVQFVISCVDKLELPDGAICMRLDGAVVEFTSWTAGCSGLDTAVCAAASHSCVCAAEAFGGGAPVAACGSGSMAMEADAVRQVGGAVATFWAAATRTGFSISATESTPSSDSDSSSEVGCGFVIASGDLVFVSGCSVLFSDSPV
nr:C2 domain containing protein [Ipomoea batatas]